MADATAMPITEQNRTSIKPSPSSLARFGDFWSVYPRKVGKQAAVRAWAKAVTKADPDKIITAVEAYRDRPGRETKFTAHPTTWLNEGRWDDAPDEDAPGPGDGGTESPWTPY